MISRLYLGNFKAFGSLQTIPVKPITLLFGPNSAGKSSILHSFLLAKHALDTGELDAHHTTVGGDSVDLGGFKQYVHRGKLDSTVEWGVQLDLQAMSQNLSRRHMSQPTQVERLLTILGGVRKVQVRVTLGLQGMLRRPLNRLDRAVHIAGSDLNHAEDSEEMYQGSIDRPIVLAYSINIDRDPLLSMSARSGGFLRLDSLNTGHPRITNLIEAILLSFTTTSSVNKRDISTGRHRLNELVPKMISRFPYFLPDQIEVELDGASNFTTERTVRDGRGLRSDQLPLFAISKDNRDEDICRAVDLYAPRQIGDLLGSLHSVISEQLHRIKYLGPLRSNPPRHMAFSDKGMPDRQFGDGSDAWKLILEDAAVREQINQWFSEDFQSTPYEIIKTPVISVKWMDGVVEDSLKERAANQTRSSDIADFADHIAPRSRDYKPTSREQIRTQLQIVRDLKNTIDYYFERLSYFIALEKERPLRKVEEEDYIQIDIYQTNLIDQLESYPKEEELVSLLENWDGPEYEPEDSGIEEFPEDSMGGNVPSEHRDRIGSIDLDLVTDYSFELSLVDKRTDSRVSFRDVGAGISQVVPVIAYALSAKNSLVAIEQPELHMHPKLQAELADLFIQSALGKNKNSFLIETHSEHLILRILRRIREDSEHLESATSVKIRPEDVAVIYAQPTKEGTKLVHIKITEDGEFATKWPDGFFAERARELF